jgi:hypothetical protein
MVTPFSVFWMMAVPVLRGITRGRLIRQVGALAQEFARRRVEQATSPDTLVSEGPTS